MDDGGDGVVLPVCAKAMIGNEAAQNIRSLAAIGAVKARCITLPRHGTNLHLKPGATALFRISSLWNRCRREPAIERELFGQQCSASGVDDDKWLELLQLFILDQFVPTIVEDQPVLVIPDGENGVIDADSIVVDEHHAHIFGAHQGHVFGEGVILAVTMPGFESAFLVDEGRSPLISDAKSTLGQRATPAGDRTRSASLPGRSITGRKNSA